MIHLHQHKFFILIYANLRDLWLASFFFSFSTTSVCSLFFLTSQLFLLLFDFVHQSLDYQTKIFGNSTEQLFENCVTFRIHAIHLTRFDIFEFCFALCDCIGLCNMYTYVYYWKIMAPNAAWSVKICVMNIAEQHAINRKQRFRSEVKYIRIYYLFCHKKQKKNEKTCYSHVSVIVNLSHLESVLIFYSRFFLF